MELNFDVCIVSAFGRNHWLATELQKAGMKVLYIDQTHRLGNWPIEDVQGPFGFFKSDYFTESQLECIYSQDAYLSMDNGFIIWTKRGPVELRGPMIKHHLFSGLIDEKTLNCIDKNISSTQFYFNPNENQNNEVAKLSSAYYIKFPTRQGVEKGIDWVKEKSVEYLKKSEVVDLTISNKDNESDIEIKGEFNGVYKFKKIIWGLTSEESHFLNVNIGNKLFKKEIKEPEWGWLRFRIKIENNIEATVLPYELLLITNFDFPWTHENFLILKSTGINELFDIWTRLPNLQRFNREYIKAKGELIISTLIDKLNGGEVTITNYPQEYYYTYNDLGAARFPLFDSVKTQQDFSNIIFSNPEYWNNYNWDGQFNFDEKLNSKLNQWWKDYLVRKEKQ